MRIMAQAPRAKASAILLVANFGPEVIAVGVRRTSGIVVDIGWTSFPRPAEAGQLLGPEVSGALSGSRGPAAIFRHAEATAVPQGRRTVIEYG